MLFPCAVIISCVLKMRRLKYMLGSLPMILKYLTTGPGFNLICIQYQVYIPNTGLEEYSNFNKIYKGVYERSAVQWSFWGDLGRAGSALLLLGSLPYCEAIEPSIKENNGEPHNVPIWEFLLTPSVQATITSPGYYGHFPSGLSDFGLAFPVCLPCYVHIVPEWKCH